MKITRDRWAGREHTDRNATQTFTPANFGLPVVLKQKYFHVTLLDVAGSTRIPGLSHQISQQ